MQKTGINPSILQEFMESASNAAAKGQSQFETPPELGARCAELLPSRRPEVLDLNCGSGKLVRAVANDTTEHRLGSDIDDCESHGVAKITHDITRLYSMMVEVGVECGCFALNPPWDLHWEKERMADLGESEVTAVREAWAEEDPRLNTRLIDSTIATLMMALDRSSYFGEGFLIANEATLQRLLFGESAPYGMLARHFWAHAVIDGNAVTGDDRIGYDHRKGEFRTGVIWFARGHTRGLGLRMKSLEEIDPSGRQHRYGANISHWHRPDPTEVWRALRDEVAARRKHVPQYNIYLDPHGVVRTHLSRFEQKSSKLDKEEARSMFRLNGVRPLQLVMQRAQRDLLLRHAGLAGGDDLEWKVDPKLQSAIEEAITEYNTARAPLYPLSKIQRLGYLDEQDAIRCVKDLGPFRAGRRYPLASETMDVTRCESRPNLAGEKEDLEFNGQELAFLIRPDPEGDGGESADGSNVTLALRFMDEALRDKKTKIAGDAEIHHTLQELIDHFEIPDVPDVATLCAERHQGVLDRIDALEAWLEQSA